MAAETGPSPTTSSEGTTVPVLVIDYTVPANTAPTLDATQEPGAVGDQPKTPAHPGAVGTLVSALVDFASPAGQVDNVTDADAGAQLGIAVTAATPATAPGSTRSMAAPIGRVGRGRATATPGCWRPTPTTASTSSPTRTTTARWRMPITFRAWDQTSGTNGGTADTSDQRRHDRLLHRHRHREPDGHRGQRCAGDRQPRRRQPRLQRRRRRGGDRAGRQRHRQRRGFGRTSTPARSPSPSPPAATAPRMCSRSATRAPAPARSASAART